MRTGGWQPGRKKAMGKGGRGGGGGRGADSWCLPAESSRFGQAPFPDFLCGDSEDLGALVLKMIFSEANSAFSSIDIFLFFLSSFLLDPNNLVPLQRNQFYEEAMFDVEVLSLIVYDS